MSNLTVKAEEEEHREEETGPERGDRQLDHGRRVGKKRQAGTCNIIVIIIIITIIYFLQS